jgi:hypothetical protein
MRLRLPVVVAALALTLGPAAAHATTTIDPFGDFLPTYDLGPKDLDLDVLSFSVALIGSNFEIGATLAGDIDPARAGLYVVGVNTGTGLIRPFMDVGAPNVWFNQAFVVRKDGTTTLNGVTATISGASFKLSAPVSLFASTGFTPDRYGFNLWPRIGLGAGNHQISDFAPNNSLINPVPEPAGWALMISGFGMIGSMLRRRRALSVAA